MELGGFAPFLFGVEARELIADRVAELTGARLTTSFGRVGGMNRDLPEGWTEKHAQVARQDHRADGRDGGAAHRATASSWTA